MNRSACFLVLAFGMSLVSLKAQTIPLPDAIISGGESDNFGWAVSGVGDVNNDGIDDLLVGAPASPALAGFAGRAFLFFGPLSGDLGSSDADVVFDPEGVFGDNFGISVTNAGDVNNDGNDDIIIGARSSDAGGIQSGRAYLHYGPFSAGTIVPGEADAIFTGAAFDELGWSAAAAGDVNNDGFGDILLGGPNALSSLGRVLLYHGPLSGNYTPADADASIVGEIADERLGSSVAGAGDVNNDGFDDLLIGQFSPLIPVPNNGRALLFYGPVSGTLSASDADAQIIGEVLDDRLGISVSSAGDMNGDGNADLLLGADQFWSGNRGKAYVFLGPLSGIVSAATAEAVLRGERNGDLFGTSVGSAGDINGDQVPDIIVGATNGGAAGAGAGYLFFGPLSGNVSASDADLILEEGTGGGWFGNSVAATGDLDDNGLRDIGIGAPLSDMPASDAGRVYVFDVAGSGSGIPCEDVSRVKAKCSSNGRVLIGINLVPGSGHDGKVVEIQVDSTIVAEATVMNDRARVEVRASAANTHLVELTDPTGCQAPLVVNCATSDAVMDVDVSPAVVPEATALFQNYPNPFNPETGIRYTLAEDGPVTLKLYDVMGREVRTLVDGFQTAGWHEARLDATNLAAGMYLYRLTYGGGVETKIMMLVK
jgi:hypothetical protein